MSEGGSVASDDPPDVFTDEYSRMNSVQLRNVAKRRRIHVGYTTNATKMASALRKFDNLDDESAEKKAMRLPEILPSRVYAPGEAIERVNGKRKNGGRIEYRIKWKGCPESDSTWKRIDDMTNVEKDARLRYMVVAKQQAKQLMSTAEKYATCASMGDERGMAQVLRQHPYDLLEDYLPSALNGSTIVTSNYIGDWGNIKQSHELYTKTKLTEAVERGDAKAVRVLLETGLCDPTLKYSLDHDNKGSTAMDVARRVKSSLEQLVYEGSKRNVDLTRSKNWCHFSQWSVPGAHFQAPETKAEIKRAAVRVAEDIIEKLTNACLIHALLEAALILWPRARYSSAEAGSSCNGARSVAKFANRMSGVTASSETQAAATRNLKKSLASATENFSMIPFDEAALVSALVVANPPDPATPFNARYSSTTYNNSKRSKYS